MTEETPDRIDIELNEDDVLNSADSILNAMSKIREEFFLSIQKDPEKNEEEYLKAKHDEEEYLHLSYRLASVIEALDGTEKHIETIIGAVKQEPALLGYDYLQSPFWQEKLPKVNKSLDKILIMMRKEKLSSMKEKHHIMQAIKYLITKDEEIGKKKDSFDNILPFLSNVTTNNKEFFEKEIKRLKLKRLKRGNAIIKLDGDKNLEKIIEVASSLGFPKLQLVTTTKRYEGIREGHPDVKIVDVPLESRLSEESYERKRRFFRKVMPYLKPITYPTLGNMPQYLKRRLEEYVGEEGFNSWTATLTSVFTNIAPYVYLIYQIGKESSKLQPPYSELGIALCVFGSIYITVESAIRGVNAGQRIHDEGPLASGIGKILSLPIELYTKRKNRSSNSKSIVVEIGLSNRERERLIDRTDYFQHLNGLACKRLNKESEENLIWSEKNHHSFGVDFAYKLLKDDKIKNGKRFIDTKNEAFNYYITKEFDGYVNLSALICKKDERYALSLVSQTKPKIEEINQMLKKTADNKEKLAEIAQKYNTEFIRLIKYEKLAKIDDYEAV